MPTPLDTSEFRRLLEGYDEEKKLYVLNGISYGFDIGFRGAYAATTCENSPLISQHLDVTRDLIQKEIDLNRMEGPFDSPPFKHFHISPLTIRPKPTPGEYRLIHNLSAPYDITAVNEGIPKSFKSVQYESVTNIIGKLLESGRHSFMAKSDIKSAFRLIPVHPKCYHLLGFKFEGKYYFDKCLTMGGGSSCRIFEQISTAINWIISEKFGITNSFHYLDDFLFLERNEEACSYDLEVFKIVCKRLGVPLSAEKTQGPCKSICFLGILLDAERMEASIPEDKLLKYRENIKHLISAEVVTQVEIKSALGCLNWCTNIVVTGRAFLRRLHDAVLGEHQPRKIVQITKEIKKDLKVWDIFLQDFNGRIFIDFMPVESSASLNFFTDASFKGAGGTFGSKWFQIAYPEHWAQKRITYLELYPIVVAAHMFAKELSGKKVVFYTDNHAVMSILNKCTSPNPKFMPLIRKLVLLIMRNNIRISSRHIRGICNVTADVISRFQVTELFLAEHRLCPTPTKVPHQWEPESWEAQEAFC